MRNIRHLALAMAVTGSVCAGCTQTSRIAVLSDGDLGGRQLSAAKRGPQLEGEDCGMSYYLSNATRQALGGTPYDTLVDVEVTSTAGITPFNQCLKVKGWGVRSADLSRTRE
jgi:hypothetical protein